MLGAGIHRESLGKAVSKLLQVTNRKTPDKQFTPKPQLDKPEPDDKWKALMAFRRKNG